jgi:histidinol-phosphate aminotransferase
MGGGRIIAGERLLEGEMKSPLVSRREFARVVGTAAAAAVAAPNLFGAAVQHAKRPANMAGTMVQIDSNENPYGPSPTALEAITQSEKIASRYPDTVEEQIRDAIAQHHKVDAENIVLGCGSTEILRVSDAAFLSPDKNVVTAEPTFEAVLSFAKVLHSNTKTVPLTADHRFDLPAIAAACTAQTGLVYICNPNNPTGTIVTKDELAAFVEKVPPSTIILVDEAYYHFADDPGYGTVIDWTGKHPNLIVARTFSKVYGMAGMRLGYAVGAKETMALMRPQVLWSNANAAVCPAAVASLADTGNVARNRELINGTRRWLCEELTKDGRKFIPSQANFLMIDVGGDVQPLIPQFKDRGIWVGRKFPSMANWLRVSMGTRPEMESFLAALRVIVPGKGASAA